MKSQTNGLSFFSDEAHQFEVKLKKFTNALEQGIEVTMWQLNRNSDFAAETKDDFTLKGSQIQMKLQRRGEFLVQGALSFNVKGGYLSKALMSRRRGGKCTSRCLRYICNCQLFLTF